MGLFLGASVRGSVRFWLDGGIGPDVHVAVDVLVVSKKDRTAKTMFCFYDSVSLYSSSA